MHQIEIFFVLALLQLLCYTDGVGECRTRKLFCYDCDSRTNEFCDDPFNRTLPPELEPPIKICHGCCVKFVHKYPKAWLKGRDGEWVQRSCTENLIINYFMVDKVCMGEGRGHGKMCFCENNYCNKAPMTTHIHLYFYLLPTICLLFKNALSGRFSFL